MPGVIVPRKTVGELRAILESNEETISVSVSETKIRFLNSSMTLTSKVIDGSFPDYTRVIPKDNNKKMEVETFKNESHGRSDQERCTGDLWSASDIWYLKFFRITLLSQTESDIIKTLKDMESGQKELKHELVKISWYMRGGLSYSEAMALSPTEREIIARLVKDNLETTKKSGQPFF